MIAEFDPKKRNRRDILSDEKQEKRNELMVEVNNKLQVFTDESDELYKEDLEFRKIAEDLIKTLEPDDEILIRTTYGKQSSEVAEHKGKFVKRYNSGLFNMHTPERGIFTVGIGCLCYIEKL